MPFLLGAFGNITQSSLAKRLSAIAHATAIEDTLYTMTCHNGIIYAGHKKDDLSVTDKILPLCNKHGVFIGRMFNRDDYLPASFKSSDTHALIQNPPLLLKKWWGRYVGSLYNPQTQVLTLMRDPQGLSTLFYTINQNGIIFSSDLALLYDAMQKKPSINLHYFAEYVTNKNFASSRTPFVGIQELLPGQGLTVQANGDYNYEILWDVSALKGSFINDEEAFQEELRHTLKSSLKAWTRESSGICLELSGGLDSSSLLILLRDIFPESNTIIGVNYFDSKVASANEKEYAQEVADLCNVPLHFIDWQNSQLLDPLPPSWRPNKPNTFLIYYNTSQQLFDLATQYNCSEIMNGQGGDHVFVAPLPIDSLADYWLDNGFGDITKLMNELRNINRMPLWILMRTMIASIAHYYCNTKKKIILNTSFLDPSFAQSYKEQEFYLIKKLKRFYPAKIKQIESLFHAAAYADRNQRIFDVTMTHPLLSQPLVELGLRIPTYQSFRNGYDRIFLRKAISRIKQPKALWRNRKGETTSSVIKLYAHNAAKIHDTLLQGRLVRDGLVNKKWLQEQMLKIRHGKADNLWSITHLLTAQMWLNQWKL